MCFNIKNVSLKDVRHGSIAIGSQNDPSVEEAVSSAQVISLNHPGLAMSSYCIDTQLTEHATLLSLKKRLITTLVRGQKMNLNS